MDLCFLLKYCRNKNFSNISIIFWQLMKWLVMATIFLILIPIICHKGKTVLFSLRLYYKEYFTKNVSHFIILFNPCQCHLAIAYLWRLLLFYCRLHYIWAISQSIMLLKANFTIKSNVMPFWFFRSLQNLLVADMYKEYLNFENQYFRVYIAMMIRQFIKCS